MSNLPWILQEKLGIASVEHQVRLTETLTADTPSTFGDLNWDHCENGSATPKSKAGVTILMGPPVTAAAGLGAQLPAVGSTVVVHTAKILREAGWVVKIIPEDYKPDTEERSAKRPKVEESDPEARYMQSDSYDFASVEIRDKFGELAGRMENFSLGCAWLCLVSYSEILTAFAKGKLGCSFAFCELQCSEFTRPFARPGYSLSGVTGISDDSKYPSTLFLLKFGDKTVGKALCTYKNGEMDSVGPTLELIEIAKEWRHHGLGTQLMEEVESYFDDAFWNVIEARGSVLFSVCYVTSRYASLWFQDHLFFDNLDGMGEELGKPLVH
jgi:GNAT superfamily N-acetyltransferase